MNARKAIRYQGKITTWKDDQGFGFIAPNGGGPLVFVHIKSFTRKTTRPTEDDGVTYELTVNEKGQPRADNVAFVGDRAPQSSSSETGSKSLLAAFSFLAIVAILVHLGKLPAIVFGAYLVMSVLAFLTYARDKAAARKNEWRTKESTLIFMGIACGWPGAIVAQRMLRHKSKKQSFQIAFWGSVVINCAALGWVLWSAETRGLLTTIGAAEF